MSQAPRQVDLGPCTAHLLQHEVRWPDRVEGLTAAEVRLLAFLLRQPCVAASRATLLTEVWGYAATVRSRTVDNTVARLRRKIEVDPSSPVILQTVKGQGYRLVLPERGQAAASSAGRDEAVDRLVGASARVVTLTGPGGIGKSWLARALLRRTPGVQVELDGATSAAEVVFRVANALELPLPDDGAIRTVARAVPAGVGLLVLDNVDDSVPAVRELVDALPAGVAVRVTCRTPLLAIDEVVEPVGPLTPDAARALLASLADVSDTEPEPLLAHLGGLPLAIEITASLLRWADVPTVVAQLDRSVTALARGGSGRHASLADVLHTTWRSLSPDEQRWLTALAVVPHSLDVSLAADLLADLSPAPLAVLDTLVQRALVGRVEGGEAPMLRIPALVRRYAVEHGAELEARRVTLARALLVLAPYDERLGLFVDNEPGVLRYRDLWSVAVHTAAALQDTEPDLAVALGARAATVAWWFRSPGDVLETVDRVLPSATGAPAEGVLRGLRGMALRLCGRLDEVEPPDAAPPGPVGAHVLNAAAIAAMDQGRLETARRLCTMAREQAVAHDLSSVAASSDALRAQIDRRTGDLDDAERRLTDAARVLWDLPLQRTALGWSWVMLRQQQGRLDEARTLAREMVATTDALGLGSLGRALRVAEAQVASAAGEPAAALALLVPLTQAYRAAGSTVSMAACAANAGLAYLQLDQDEAARACVASVLHPNLPPAPAVAMLRAVHAVALALLGRSDEAAAVLGACEPVLLPLGDPLDFVAVGRLFLAFSRGDAPATIRDGLVGRSETPLTGILERRLRRQVRGAVRHPAG